MESQREWKKKFLGRKNYKIMVENDTSEWKAYIYVFTDEIKLKDSKIDILFYMNSKIDILL